MKIAFGALLVLVVVVLGARFRVNLWTLTPWSFKPPSRLDDSIEPLKELDTKNPQ